MSDPSNLKMPGWLRDAAGAPIPPDPQGRPISTWGRLWRWALRRLLQS
jgi:hypothetical protein